jgi:hypothetical protein
LREEAVERWDVWQGQQLFLPRAKAQHVSHTVGHADQFFQLFCTLQANLDKVTQVKLHEQSPIKYILVLSQAKGDHTNSLFFRSLQTFHTRMSRYALYLFTYLIIKYLTKKATPTNTIHPLIILL